MHEQIDVQESNTKTILCSGGAYGKHNSLYTIREKLHKVAVVDVSNGMCKLLGLNQ